MPVFKDMAYLLQGKLRAICPSSMRRLSHLRFLPGICLLFSVTMCDAMAPTLQDGAPPMLLKCQSGALLPNHCQTALFLQLAGKLILSLWTKVDIPYSLHCRVI